MASYHNSGPFAPGMSAIKYAENEWAFQCNTIFEPVYEGNFEADIDAIAESIGDDSGYFSNDTDSFEVSNSGVAHYDDRFPPYNEHKTIKSLHSNNFCTDVTASNKSNHGSIYDRTLNKSTTHLENGTSYGKQPKETRMSKTLYHPVHEYDHKTPHKYSIVSESSGLRPLEIWEATHERHEWIAYQLHQPPKQQSSKRRKTGGRK